MTADDERIFCGIGDILQGGERHENFFDQCAWHKIHLGDAEVAKQVALLATDRRKTQNRLSARRSREAAKCKRARLEAEVERLTQVVLVLQTANGRMRLRLANHGAAAHV